MIVPLVYSEWNMRMNLTYVLYAGDGNVCQANSTNVKYPFMNTGNGPPTLFLIRQLYKSSACTKKNLILLLFVTVAPGGSIKGI